MHSIFLLYMPPGNNEAMVHYEDTIKRRVGIETISRFVSPNLRSKLVTIFGSSRIAVWGSQSGTRNRINFENMAQGDDILIIEGDRVRLIGKIAAKTEDADLSKELWKPLRKGGETTWELIYFIANPRELDLPFKELCTLFGFKKTFRLRGFTPIAEERLEAFYKKYDDLYSILVRLQSGEPIKRKASSEIDETVVPPVVPSQLLQVERSDIEEEVQAGAPSDHATMQWKLARLGLKAGERVWVPVSDQAKLRSTFKFDGFDPEFAAGIDLPHSYIENIDVVWKQEFRIGAAYEIENSTSIYSGLLRFADLNIVAPNTLYPMFIVAPNNRRNRLREQLRRPTFRRLELHQKVRFLSYEAINDIDTFFSEPESGLSVDVVLGRSELVA